MFRQLLLMGLICAAFYGKAQIHPISLDDRIRNSDFLVKGKLLTKHSFWNVNNTEILTANVFSVSAYAKQELFNNTISVITHGGQVGEHAQLTFPESQFEPAREYLLLLKNLPEKKVSQEIRKIYPEVLQTTVVSRISGALSYNQGFYTDVFENEKIEEISLFKKISSALNADFFSPGGQIYEYQKQRVSNRLSITVSNITDGTGGSGPFVGGTILPENELIISGSGFESSRGSGFVAFSNSDDAGASFVFPSNDSDYISWSDTEIRLKIPNRAGTGSVYISNNSGDTALEPISIKWGVTSLQSDFYNWTEVNRNRVEYVDNNGTGGYTFQYSSVGGMDTNSDAQTAFENAVSTLRCDSGINLEISATNTNVGVGADGINSVCFGTLGSGTTGIATVRYTANGNTSCDSSDTFWRVNEIDLIFDNSTNWYYGNGSCTQGQYDFESTALHELGHAHGLQHINDPSLVMHYVIGECNSASNIRHNFSTGESEAANHKTAHSFSANCFSPPNYPGPMNSVSGAFCSLLPVELISFFGKIKGDDIELFWKTASEIQNEGFEIEKKIKNENWITIGFVKGNGDSSVESNFQFSDKSPENGINHYRLKQIDYDGNFQYSNVITFDLNFEKNILFQIFPNPLGKEKLNIKLETEEETQADLFVFNSLGQLIISKAFYENDTQISFDNRPAGIYFLEVRKGKNRFQKKIKVE